MAQTCNLSTWCGEGWCWMISASSGPVWIMEQDSASKKPNNYNKNPLEGVCTSVFLHNISIRVFSFSLWHYCLVDAILFSYLFNSFNTTYPFRTAFISLAVHEIDTWTHPKSHSDFACRQDFMDSSCNFSIYSDVKLPHQVFFVCLFVLFCVYVSQVR